MSYDLMLKTACSGCGSQSELYGSTCKHMTLCLQCGKTMAENKGKCYECGTTVTRLIREYNVRASLASDKNYFIGRFVTGLPNFKKNVENKWSLRKDGIQGRQLTDAQREKLKNKPWVLEDETGQFQFQGHLEGSQSATYYLLVLQNKEFFAIPAGSWFNFNKVAQYKQLTLEEAEEKMKNRRKTADGYQRWMMKTANNGPAAFGEVDKFDDKESGGGGGGRGRKKSSADDDEGNVSDRGEEDEDAEAARKSRLGLNKKDLDDDEEGPRGGDHDMDDDDIEKGDDWEHEEIFTDDDEAVGNDPEEREDLAPEMPAPPEIKQDDDEENEEEEGGLSKSGKELKKLLGKANGLNDSDTEDEDDSEDMDEDMNLTPVAASKQKDATKEEPVEMTPPKPVPSGSARGTPTSTKPSKGKRKLNDDDGKKSSGAAQKKETKSSVKEERTAPVSKSSASKAVKTEANSSVGSSLSSTASNATGPVTEDEIRAVLLEKKQVTTQDLVSRFKSRLKTKEDKNAFADILRKISKIQKNAGSQNFVVLREK
ncbi:PREDICTED: transcription initiation factor IIF subunit alpha isoform X2 [Tarenaya hassleriana]|uniref:transcription initiation factor IIF subunit alpha isoform X2 n=1 Tax=Tarenaya hassleriana TaxID=28532 RepID=UPI00053C29DB|nr:PREDICTED: transcription initiation factor IIF subunit alpha isoform X2 [Tarenaya hassleriana]